MPRVKNSAVTRARRKKVLEKAKGYTGGRRKLFKSAKETVQRSGMYAFRDRKAKKRDFRSLWVVRLNAALDTHELSYSRFIGLLNKSDIRLNRKVLSNMAVEDPEAFAEVVNTAKKNA